MISNIWEKLLFAMSLLTYAKTNSNIKKWHMPIIKKEGGFNMPRRDGKGPKGDGSMTGRMMGVCKNSNDLDFKPGFGMGRGMGAGMKLDSGCKRGFRGCGFGMGRPFDKASRKEMVGREKEVLEERLSQIKKEIEE